MRDDEGYVATSDLAKMGIRMGNEMRERLCKERHRVGSTIFEGAIGDGG